MEKASLSLIETESCSYWFPMQQSTQFAALWDGVAVETPLKYAGTGEQNLS